MVHPRPAKQGLPPHLGAHDAPTPALKKGSAILPTLPLQDASGDFTQSAPGLLMRSKYWRALRRPSWMVGTLPAISIQSTSGNFAQSALLVRNQKLRRLVPVSRRAREIPSMPGTSPHLRSEALQTTPILGPFLIVASIAQRYLLRTCRGSPLTPMPPAGGNRGLSRIGKGGT